MGIGRVCIPIPAAQRASPVIPGKERSVSFNASSEREENNVSELPEGWKVVM